MKKTRSFLLLAILPVALAAQTPPRPSRAPSPAAPPQGVPMPAEAPLPMSTPTPMSAPSPLSTPMSYSLATTFPQGLDYDTPSMSARFPQDPADSTYREARSMLNRGEWRRAARLFAEVGNRSPASAYSADALYWQAFALYRLGGTTDLREALQALDARKAKFPRADNADEAESLATRVSGALASRGDASARSRVATTAAGGGGMSCDSEELSVRASALSTLMRNDPDAAMPILVKVLDRKDECSASMRRSAVMLIGTKGDAAAKSKLNDVARTDPSTPVRADAIGYIAQSNTDEAVNTLDGILRNETDLGVQRSVVRALGSMENAKAKAAIKALVERSTAPERLRLDAIASFDRRAGFSYSYACSQGGDCRDFGITTSINVDGRAFITPAPAAPVAIAAPAIAPVAPLGSSASAGRASEEARAAAARDRAEANAEARAEARAQADMVRSAAVAGRATTPRAYTVSGDEVRWSGGDDDDRRISPEDAAWLRGVYPRFETNRLKTAAIAVLARAKDEPTRTWLTNAMAREDEPAEVRAAILSRLGRELPIANLARLYDNASGRSQRQEIVNLLGNRSEPEATDKLIEIVRTGTDPQLRRSAINALGQKKDPRTTQLLLELIDK